MPKTKETFSMNEGIRPVQPRLRWQKWLSICLALALAVGGWFWLSRLSQAAANSARLSQSDGEPTYYWPTEVIYGPTASGRSFLDMTGRSLAYYTDKNRTIQQLHLAYGGKNLYYATTTWISPTWSAWTTEIVDSSADVGRWASIAVDTFNRPHIAYYNMKNGCLKYAYKNVTWTIQTLDCDNTLLPLEDDFVSPAFDPSGEHYIESTTVTLDETNGFPLKQADSASQSDNSPLADPASGSGKYTSIAIDSYGRPHISYTKFYPRSDRIYHKLKYAYFDGSAWKIWTVFEDKNSLRSLNEGLFTSLAVDSRDRPHIAFLDDDHDKVRYTFSPRENNWTFSYPTPAGIGQYDNLGGWNSLVLRPGEPQDKAYIAFYDKTRGALTMAEGTYKTDIKNYTWNTYRIDNAGDVGLFASLADKNGKDFGVSYFDESWDDLRYAEGKAGEWNIKVVTGTNSRAGRYTSLVFDFNQKPHITYFDFSEGALYEAYVITNTWRFRLIDTSDTLGAGAVSLDQSNQPHIVYYNDLLGRIKSVRNATNWIEDTTISTRLSTDQRVAFRVDSAGRSHLAYYDPSSQDLVYGIKDGLAWSFETLDSLGDVGHNPALALDSANKPYVSYFDATNGRIKLAFKNSSNQWQTEVVAAAGNASGSFSSIVVHPTTNDIYIGFYDASSQSLKLAYTPSSNPHVWSVEVVDNAPKSGWHNALVLDASGKPHLAYYEATNQVLKFASAANSLPPFDFSLVTVDNASRVGKYCSLAVDGSGFFHVSYYDEANTNLKYALFDGSEWATQIVDSAGDVGMWSSLVIDPSTNIPHILYYDSTNKQWKYTIDKPWKIEGQVFLPLINR